MFTVVSNPTPLYVFEAVKHIDVDRKNSLPLADFQNRYLTTSTPVVFGNMTHSWPAFRKWNFDFFKKELANHDLDIYSHKVGLNQGDSQRPVTNLSGANYFDLLMHEEDVLQVRNLDILSINPKLINDFSYPRLGLTFKKKSPRLHIGGAGANEHMHYRADLAESFICNFGGRQHVLLVRPELAKYTYEPPLSFESLTTVDYSKKGLKKNPAVGKIDGYYAELNHGDVLFIPSGYRYSIHYSTISFGLVLAASPSKFKSKFRARYNKHVVTSCEFLLRNIMGDAWQRRRIRKAVRRSKN